MVAQAALPDFSSIVKAYGPAVVNITVTGKLKNASTADEGPGLDPNDPFFEFFRRFGPNLPRTPHGPDMQGGLGSGFIVGSDGVILTNAHVVDGAAEVIVKLTDKREFKAKVTGVDRRSDVAVLKIDAANLPVVKLGDPGNMKVGEWVLAIGSPFGFENTATAGIVSAKSRALPDGTYVPFIQTDVAVNPGNSGGPLFNLNGEVIGINSQIYTRSGGYQGLSFAIPIDVATKVKDQLVAHGKVVRGRLGVSIQDVNQALAESFGLKQTKGALVSGVEKDGPAAAAGLQAGDVIVGINDKPIDVSADLPARVGDMQPGTRARLEVIRKGESRRIEVALGEMKDPKGAAAENAQAANGKLGLVVRQLDPDERRQAGLSGGLVVEQAAGPAARAGIRPGDVILSLNGNPVKSVEDLRSLAAKAGKHAALLVQREDAKIFVPVDLG